MPGEGGQSRARPSLARTCCSRGRGGTSARSRSPGPGLLLVLCGARERAPATGPAAALPVPGALNGRGGYAQVPNKGWKSPAVLGLPRRCPPGPAVACTGVPAPEQPQPGNSLGMVISAPPEPPRAPGTTLEGACPSQEQRWGLHGLKQRWGLVWILHAPARFVVVPPAHRLMPISAPGTPGAQGTPPAWLGLIPAKGREDHQH
ncbi:collagen alpha-1(I) chain-like [Manacus candei]|uniref:collagen alpha-1(I) chain-like n=1 Tax=Manacus candei TaxID=415023 RepID=UPI002226DE3A|nr:collagen alpha-1(I) chain-like [Manacus candei]